MYKYVGIAGLANFLPTHLKLLSFSVYRSFCLGTLHSLSLVTPSLIAILYLLQLKPSRSERFRDTKRKYEVHTHHRLFPRRRPQRAHH